jgi:chromosome segregation ATPase
MYTDFLKAGDTKAADLEDEIKGLELQIDEITGENQQIGERNEGLRQFCGELKDQIEDLVGHNDALNQQLEELKQLNADLNQRNANLTASHANWRGQALRSTKELVETKESDKKLMEILQRRR